MRKSLAMLLFSRALLLAPVFAETIVLQSGETIEAPIVDRTDEYIRVDVSGIPITYYREDVKSINGEVFTAFGLPAEEEQRPQDKEAQKSSAEEEGKSEGPYTEEINTLIREEKYTEAERVARAALERYPQRWDLLDSLAEIYVHQKRFQESVEILEGARRRAPDEPKLLISLGRVYDALKDYQQAIVYYDKAAALGDNSYELNVGLGMAHSNLFDYPRAKTYLEEAIRLAGDVPDVDQVYFNLARVYIGMFQPQKAVERLRELIRLRPDSCQAHSMLYAAYRQLNDKVKGKETLIKGIYVCNQTGETEQAKVLGKFLETINWEE